MIAGADSENLFLRQELPENDCTQTSQLLKSYRWETATFFLAAGLLSHGRAMLEQAGAAQGSLLPASARLGVGSCSGLAPEPSPVREPARLVQRASGRRTGMLAAPCQRCVWQWLGERIWARRGSAVPVARH